MGMGFDLPHSNVSSNPPRTSPRLGRGSQTSTHEFMLGWTPNPSRWSSKFGKNKVKRDDKPCLQWACWNPRGAGNRDQCSPRPTSPSSLRMPCVHTPGSLAPSTWTLPHFVRGSPQTLWRFGFCSAPVLWWPAVNNAMWQICVPTLHEDIMSLNQEKDHGTPLPAAESTLSYTSFKNRFYN